jgi:acyl-homoserine-lactone acylase
MNRTCFTLTALAAAAVLAGCATAPSTPPEMRTASIQRTANGVPHISAPDLETLAYGVAYAHAEDNVCQTAQQLVTVRGERSRYFGGTPSGLLGRRMFPNEWIDFFIAGHMDDAALAAAWGRASADTQAMVRGYVAGYNRYLQDKAATLPAACKGQPWVQPMTTAHYYRLAEVASVQAGIGALADAMLAAQPPKATAQAPTPTLQMADAVQALREAGLVDSPLGSNAWAIGKAHTANGSGLLLGNPHFPWAGVNRFWQMHLTVPGRMDVMGAATGHSPVVQIGFNKDVAWSHTVSTGKRFTLHELKLVAGDPTSYLVDGQPEKMRSRTVQIAVRGGDGHLTQKPLTLWSTRWGPVVVMPRAGLNWTPTVAYALQDANAGNARSTDTWLAFATATGTQDLRKALSNLGMPWVNTIAADRQGNAMYADVSVVPDVDAAHMARCSPSPQAAALRGPAGLIVLDGSKSDCGWKRDPASAVSGLTPAQRMPVAIRSDWVQNSNDSFFYSNPQQSWSGISPMVGDDIVRRPRTRSSLIELPELVARGPVTAAAVQAQLFSNRNLMARAVLPDLLAACAGGAPTPEAKDGCAALRGWDRQNNLDSRGAHLFRLFWRSASGVPGVYRMPFDKAEPVATPAGLKMDDAAVSTKVWEALAQAVKALRAADIQLDAPLGAVQRPLITNEEIPLHGGEEIEGVLNNLGNQFSPGVTNRGLRIDYGTSYVQTVTFDSRGPVAQGLLTYGQSTNPASPHATDQMKLYSAKQWPALPFHADDVAKQRVGEVLRLTRP